MADQNTPAPAQAPAYHPEDPTRHQHSAARSATPAESNADSRASAQQGVTGAHGDYPKPYVRAKPGPNGWEAEVRMVADADGEQVAKDEGFQAVELPERRADFVEYPKWQHHADGRSQLVHTKEEADALDGYADLPPEPEGDVPPPTGPPAGGTAKNRPPVPADRG